MNWDEQGMSWLWLAAVLTGGGLGLLWVGRTPGGGWRWVLRLLLGTGLLWAFGREMWLAAAAGLAAEPWLQGGVGLSAGMAAVLVGAVLLPGRKWTVSGANPKSLEERGERQASSSPVVGRAESLTGAKAGAKLAADLGGGVKLELCGIPAGTFTMGGTGSDETPHPVTLTQPFWLGRTEVTQAQWETVMGNNPSNFKGKDLPVEQVSWNDASEFCRKLNAKGLLPAGWQWALPSEAQWEYACRAGTTEDYAGTLDEMAWYDGNCGSKTHAVATKQANAWGLNDMHGNVWEWCADWYDQYPPGAATDPTGPNKGSLRVFRGGSWISVGSNGRSAYRYWNSPVIRNFSIGFRVAAVPVEREPAGAGDERAVPLADTAKAEETSAKSAPSINPHAANFVLIEKWNSYKRLVENFERLTAAGKYKEIEREIDREKTRLDR